MGLNLEGKIIKKKIFHSILIFFVVVVAIITSLFIAIQDPIVQKFAVRFAGGFLSEKTGADIKVGRLVVTPDFRVMIDDVVVKDLKDNNLANIGVLRTKINLPDLVEGKIHLENVILRDTEANLITYEGEDKLNFVFLLDAFPSDTTTVKESKPLAILVDRISLKNIDFMLWNQNTADTSKTARHLMDYSHLDLDDISLEATNFYMLGDSIRANIANLAAKELSGLELKNFKTDAVVCSKGVFLDGLLMETNNSRFDLDLHMLFDGFSAIGSFVDSVVFDATIRPSDVMLSDIGVFTEVMYKMPDRVLFEGRFTGPIEHFSVDGIKAKLGKSTSFQGSISMHPLNFENGYHTLNIKNMCFNYDDLVSFYIPSSTKTIPLPESLRPMGDSRLSLDFKGSYNDFKTDIMLASGIGDIETSVSRSKDKKGANIFAGYIYAEKVKAGTIANASKYVGDINLNADFSVKFPQKGNPELDLNGKVSQANLLGKDIDEIVLNGAMEQNMFKGVIKVDDNDLKLDFNGLIDFQDTKKPKSDFVADIRKADLSALSIMKNDSISEISTKIYANMTGFDPDNLEGTLRLDSTRYRDGRGEYFMKEFNAVISNDEWMMRRANLNCDFFDFELAGQVNFAHLVPTLKAYINHYMAIPTWSEEMSDFEALRKKEDTQQDFIVKLNLKDTKTLSRLLMPSLKIAKNTSLNATFTSRSNALNMTLRSKNIKLGELNFNDLEVKNFTMMNSAVTSLSLDKIAYDRISETDTLSLWLDNFSIVTRMINDTLFARLKWDDDTVVDRNKGDIETYFHPHVGGGIFSFTKAEILVNDSLWTVSPNNFVDLNNGTTEISNLMFGYNSQSIRADGFVPMSSSDTLSVQLRNFDISNFDLLLACMGFDANGFISGDAMLSGLNAEPMVLADLRIDKLDMNGAAIGDASIESSWDNEDKSLDVEVNLMHEEKRSLHVEGSYFTKREKDNLDFIVMLDSLQLASLSPFLTGVVTRMQGWGNGQATVKGSLNQPRIEGRLALDGGCKVNYLNTFYTFKPTILIDNQMIKFEDMVLVDTLGNQALVEGGIKHKNLKDFNLDIKVHPRNFLAMATGSKDNNTFYGTAVADGLISVNGPFKDILLDIKARTKRGTDFVIPLNKSTTVKENDFIVFVSKEEVEEEEEVVNEKPEKVKGNFKINLDIDATDDAKLKIFLPGNLGTIEATGNGNVKMRTSTTEDFTMFGGYTIKSGQFQLVLMDLVTRTFDLKEGGSLSWSGNPTDGRINATGAYSVKASLSSLGLKVDSTASNSNVAVECLIHLKGALLNPSITFGMRMPNASEDITQTVFSVVDTTNQAVMAQQALSLLVLNSFSYVGSGVGQFNLVNMLGGGLQMKITDNVDVGFKYHWGDAKSYDEYQLALRTQLFENRLSIETNVGMMSNVAANNASSIVGEFDLYYKLTKDGHLQAHFYNHSNYSTNFNSASFDRRAPYTQGLGLSYSRSFDTFRNLFKKKTTYSKQPMIQPKKRESTTDRHE